MCTLCLGYAANADEVTPHAVASSVIAAPQSLLELHLTASQTTYRVGDPVLVKLEVFNRSSDVIAVSDVVPWDAATLVLLRDGTVVAPSSSSVSGWHTRFPGQPKVQPGQSYAYRYWGSLGSGPTAFFYPITDWGYWQRLPAGHYTIIATPHMVVGMHSRQWFHADKHNASNAVQIDIVP